MTQPSKPFKKPIAPQATATDAAKGMMRPVNTVEVTYPGGVHEFLARIQQAKEAMADPFYTWLIYGRSGSGKTTLVASAGLYPETSPMLMLSYDQSYGSLAGINSDLVTVVPVSTWDDIWKAIHFLKTEDHGYKSVAFDGLTDLNRMGLMTIVQYEVESTTNRDRDPLAVEQADFGKNMNLIMVFLHQLRELKSKMNVFVIAQAGSRVQPKVGAVEMPQMFGQLANEVAGFFDMTIYTTVISKSRLEADPNKREAPQFIMITGNNPTVLAKTRGGWGVVMQSEIPFGQTNGIAQFYKYLQHARDVRDGKVSNGKIQGGGMKK